MYQIKLTDEQYRYLYFALGIAEEATRVEALNVADLGLSEAAKELQLEARSYKALQAFITKHKEVL